MDSLNALLVKLHTMVVFRGLLETDVFSGLLALAGATGAPTHVRAARYADLAAAIYGRGGDLTGCVLALTLESDNVYARKRAQNLPVGDNLAQCVRSELQTLEQVSRLTPAGLGAQLGLSGFLPQWDTRAEDFAHAYAARMDSIGRYGFGVYARHHVFTLRGGRVTPVKTPDPVRLGDLKGYQRQKKAVEDNTRALLCGKPAANVLLYGDAGTGKSSTVKALANDCHPQGLRLIELPKKQFRAIPALMETLAGHPLKFILFIDDLSFSQQGEDFNALKAILEGSVCAKAPNTVVYATSNRRHIVRELFSDRSGDDIHRNETMQELCALSARFGLTVGFFKPDKPAYLAIVRALMAQFGLQMDETRLETEAERFASAGRSPRAARQFIDHLINSSSI